jgi:hypothetical protein
MSASYVMPFPHECFFFGFGSFACMRYFFTRACVAGDVWRYVFFHSRSRMLTLFLRYFLAVAHVALPLVASRVSEFGWVELARVGLLTGEGS